MSFEDNLCYFLNYNFDKLQQIRRIYHPESSRAYQSPVARSLVEFNRAGLEWKFYKKYFTSLDNKLILDVGCGFGGKSVFFALKKANVIGIDIKMEKFILLQD